MRLRPALLAGLVLAGGGGVAMAQPASSFDPTQLPAIHGTVAEYRLTPRGDVGGIILQDGTLVHLPPRFGAALV